MSEAAGLAEAVRGTRPRVCFFGHHHHRVDAEIDGIRCIGLNKVARPGNLVAVEIAATSSGFRMLGEWPEPPSTAAAFAETAQVDARACRRSSR